jgi:HK97 family phage major capsid protein
MRNIAEMKRNKTKLVEETRGWLDTIQAEGREMTDLENGQYEERMGKIQAADTAISREEELQRHEMMAAQKEDLDERGKKVGEFGSLAEMLAAARFNPNDSRLSKRFIYEDGIPVNNMTTDQQGGYLVPDRFLEEILKIGPEDAVVRPRAQVIPAGYPPDAQIDIPVLAQSAHGVYGGVEVEWISEGEEKPASKPKFDIKSLKPHEVAGRVVVTDKLLRNARAFEPMLRDLLRQAVIGAEENAFLTGSGVGQPTGIISHVSNVLVNRAGANAIAYADIVEMYSSQLMGGRYVWIASQTVLPQLMTLTDTVGNLIWQPNARDGAPGTLLGAPALVTGRTPTLGNRGDLMLCDLKYYLIKDGSGIFIDALSSGTYFDHNKTVIKITWNVDGNPWPRGTFTLEDGTTEVSPFVVLDIP